SGAGGPVGAPGRHRGVERGRRRFPLRGVGASPGVLGAQREPSAVADRTAGGGHRGRGTRQRPGRACFTCPRTLALALALASCASATASTVHPGRVPGTAGRRGSIL